MSATSPIRRDVVPAASAGAGADSLLSGQRAATDDDKAIRSFRINAPQAAPIRDDHRRTRHSMFHVRSRSRRDPSRVQPSP
jgi:hypothetical protein